MWIISLHVSSPGIWHMDQHDGIEERSHGDMLFEKHCHGLWSARPLTGGFLVFEPHTGMVSDLRKTGTISALRPVLKIETHLKQKYPQGENIDCCWHQFVSSESVLSRPCFLWACEVRDLRQDFQKKNKQINECMNEYINEWMNPLLWKAQYALMVKTTYQGFLDSLLSDQVNILWKQLINFTSSANCVKMLGYRRDQEWFLILWPCKAMSADHFPSFSG